jgi:glycosyltransferase involved in cell wall biosynthesis
MDILFSSPRFPPDKNIGTLTLLASRLHDRGHEVTGIQETRDHLDEFPIELVDVPPTREPWWVRLWWYYRTWRREVSSYLETHSPEVIVTNQRTHIPTLQGAQAHSVPVVALIEGLGFMRYNPTNLNRNKRPSFFDLPVKKKPQYPFIRSLYRQQREAFPEFADVIGLSDFLCEVVDATFGTPSTMIRASIDVDSVRADHRDPGYITMVNPRTEVKGGDIFVDIAERMPDREFFVAGHFARESSSRKAERLDNVYHPGWIDDMREVYAKSKILLVPSLVEEGNPRVKAEAFANGIPVVGTDRGGVPEMLDGAGAVVTPDPYDINEWRRQIESVESDYELLSAGAQEHVTAYDIDENVPAFLEVIRGAADGG